MEKPFSGLPSAIALPKPKKAKMNKLPVAASKPKKGFMNNKPAPMLGTYKKVR